MNARFVSPYGGFDSGYVTTYNDSIPEVVIRNGSAWILLYVANETAWYRMAAGYTMI